MFTFFLCSVAFPSVLSVALLNTTLNTTTTPTLNTTTTTTLNTTKTTTLKTTTTTTLKPILNSVNITSATITKIHKNDTVVTVAHHNTNNKPIARNNLLTTAIVVPIPIVHKKADHYSIKKRLDNFALNVKNTTNTYKDKNRLDNFALNVKNTHKDKNRFDNFALNVNNKNIDTDDTETEISNKDFDTSETIDIEEDYNIEEFNKTNDSRSDNDNESTVSTAIINVSNLKDDTRLRRQNYTDVDNFTAVNVTPDSIELSEEEMLFKILGRQMVLIEKLATDLQRSKKKTPKTDDFEELLKEMEIRRDLYVNSTFKEAATTTARTTTTTTSKPSTILTIFDEDHVRKALKHDPFVSRIMKMARKKRVRYVKKHIKHNTV